MTCARCPLRRAQAARLVPALVAAFVLARLISLVVMVAIFGAVGAAA